MGGLRTRLLLCHREPLRNHALETSDRRNDMGSGVSGGTEIAGIVDAFDTNVQGGQRNRVSRER